MTLDADKIQSHVFADRTRAYTSREAILYALCCGAETHENLSFVHEDGLRVIPSFGQNLCFDDSWMQACGVDLARVVHGGLDLRMYRPFVPEATLVARPRIAGLLDKGDGKAALILLATDLLDGDEIVFTSYSNLFVMGGGGFGGSRGEAFEMIRSPERQPDATTRIASRPDSPLLFRLLGDLNALHVLPEAARAAGFERPIMHGANTFGLVCFDVLRHFCDGDPARMSRFAARFSGPLYPGEELEVSYWNQEGGVRFAARSVGRDKPVLDGGLARFA
ncbi:MaoC family dehydratase [Chelativorans sp. Marseille-P2723]|uniref:MaoC family dehydratase n=1 Tax=Chelativorans sp. Marseille-P2723 TaxID=2709133 RepID=UPI00156E1CA7|nr:MaoC family dehydratase [Chelativorans sp. Marseille-P2723]